MEDDNASDDIMEEVEYLQDITQESNNLLSSGNIILKFSVDTAADLQFLIEIEDPAIHYQYKRDGLLNSASRESLSMICIRTALKREIQRKYEILFENIFDNQSFFNDFRLIRADFVKMAEIIIELFPNENSYTWFQVNTKTYCGKLWNSYRAFRNKYKNLGVIANEKDSFQAVLDLGILYFFVFLISHFPLHLNLYIYSLIIFFSYRQL
jgi:hypothetical protein